MLGLHAWLASLTHIHLLGVHPTCKTRTGWGEQRGARAKSSETVDCRRGWRMRSTSQDVRELKSEACPPEKMQLGEKDDNFREEITCFLSSDAISLRGLSWDLCLSTSFCQRQHKYWKALSDLLPQTLQQNKRASTRSFQKLQFLSYDVRPLCFSSIIDIQLKNKNYMYLRYINARWCFDACIHCENNYHSQVN